MQRAASFGYRAERIFGLAASLLVGLGLTLLVARPGAPDHEADARTIFWLMTLAIAIVAGLGAVWLRRSEGRNAGSVARVEITIGRFAIPTELVLPSLLAAGFSLILQVFEGGIVQALVLSAAALSFAAVYWAQTHSVDTADRYFAFSHSVLNVLSHLAAFLLFSVVYGLKERALVSATAVAAITTLLVLELLLRDTTWKQALHSEATGSNARLFMISAAAGAVLAQLTWGLNYWAALTTLVGGAFLLVAFYIVYGLVSHYVEGSLDRQTFLEFGTVGAIAMAVIFGSAFIGNG
jgi:uncharacterized protein DUF5656